MSSTETFSPEIIGAVQDSWTNIKEKVGENRDLTVSLLIFENFFRDYPSTLRYFKAFGEDAETIMKHDRFQEHAGKKVFATIDKIIGNLDKPEELRKINIWLGKVHKPKRIEGEDFTNLGNTIVKTVKQALGEEGPAVEEAWKTFIDSLMKGVVAYSSK